MIKNRLAKLRRKLIANNLDGLLVTTPFNRRYLSGFRPDDGQFGETSGGLLIAQRGAYILTDFRYKLSALDQAPLFSPAIYRRGLAAEAARLAGELGIKRLGFESEALFYEQHRRLAEAAPGLELVPTRHMVEGLREIKGSAELAAIRQSLGLMEKVLAKFLAADLVGRTELEVARELIRDLEDQGADGVAFDPIVATGPNVAEPHAEPGNTVIREGHTVLFDVGAKLNGYMSDISRTIVAGGPDKADDKFWEIYRTVKQAQDAAIESIVPGLPAGEADAIARDIIEAAGYGENFGHSLGHGVGLATHEPPHVAGPVEDPLLPGMVFTVEPGIYLPGWGGVRLEQMVLLTDAGCQVLNTLDGFYH